MKIIPTGPEILHEAIMKMAALVLVAWALYQIPSLRAYVTGSREPDSYDHHG